MQQYVASIVRHKGVRTSILMVDGRLVVFVDAKIASSLNAIYNVITLGNDMHAKRADIYRMRNTRDFMYNLEENAISFQFENSWMNKVHFILTRAKMKQDEMV